MYDVAEKIYNEGMEQGRIQEKVLLIRNMLQSGLSDEDIKKYTKVTDQDIQHAKEIEFY